MLTNWFSLSADTGIILLASLTAFLTVAGLGYALFERDPMQARARMLERWRAELEGRIQERQTSRRRRQLAAIATSVADRLRLAQTKGVEAIREQLTVAGFRNREAVAAYLVASLVAPPLGVLAAFALMPTMPAARTSFLLFLSAGGLVGLLAPRWYLRFRIQRRLGRLRRALPDALDLLVICAEAGLSLDAALQRVARELARASSELADELALTAIELTVLPERRQALHNFARRVPLPAAKALISTLVQTERYGTPLAASLRVLASELREQRLIRAEEKAARLPAVLTVPLIVFILPALFVVLAGPAVIDIYDQLIRR